MLMMKGGRAVAKGDNSSVAGKAHGGDAPPDVEDTGAIDVEHRPSGQRWVEQENEEGPAQALQARP
jgi:hypothetical protein